MVSPRRGRQGATALGCLLALAVLAAAGFYGVHIGGVYLRYYELLDDMGQQARFAAENSDDVIETRLLAQADSLLGQAPDFRITRGRGQVSIQTEYSETVELPLFRHTFILKPRAEAPL